MGLGQNIWRLRELKNMTRPQMASKLGIGITAYGNIEREQSTINEERKKKIADILGMTTEEIELFNADNAIHTITNGG